jgi:hypothetical protein
VHEGALGWPELTAVREIVDSLRDANAQAVKVETFDGERL